jgi:hypothetical protein
MLTVPPVYAQGKITPPQFTVNGKTYTAGDDYFLANYTQLREGDEARTTGKLLHHLLDAFAYDLRIDIPKFRQVLFVVGIESNTSAEDPHRHLLLLSDDFVEQFLKEKG